MFLNCFTLTIIRKHVFAISSVGCCKFNFESPDQFYMEMAELISFLECVDSWNSQCFHCVKEKCPYFILSFLKIFIFLHEISF